MEAPKQSDLSFDAWPFYWLIRANVRYLDALNSALEGTGLDPSSWRVIMVLAENHWLSVSELASQANTKLSTMTKTVNRMKADGLVTTREGTVDRRVTEVTTTAKGRALAPIANDAAQHVYTRAFGRMSESSAALLNELLSELADNLR
ncbi:MarR family transcriptional regulator [Altererythrobacter soli]|uniref:MarR family transcriptional regulator n=1 Tax=Croceibacterium soli TaxID=1739690 RepID=A0A6I4UTE1_9SPHN|nr:MarR family transcriptional regulator [Croceibacterium soli]MXP42041.1 MarR family transcriptional regulator [Croceibacterium soli]